MWVLITKGTVKLCLKYETVTTLAELFYRYLCHIAATVYAVFTVPRWWW